MYYYDNIPVWTCFLSHEIISLNGHSWFHKQNSYMPKEDPSVLHNQPSEKVSGHSLLCAFHLYKYIILCEKAERDTHGETKRERSGGYKTV